MKIQWKKQMRSIPILIQNQINIIHHGVRIFRASFSKLRIIQRITKKKIRVQIQKNKQQINLVLKDGQQLYQKIQKSNILFINESKEQLDKLRKMQTKFLRKIQIQTQQRKQRQTSIIGLFQQKADQLKKQIENQRIARQNLFIEITNTLEDDLPFIMQQVNSAKNQFQNQQQQTTKSCLQILAQTQKYVSSFTEEQESHSNRAFELIRDLTKKIRAEIQEQKSVCQATHEEVFAYVEQTCNKLVQL